MVDEDGNESEVGWMEKLNMVLTTSLLWMLAVGLQI